MVDLQTHLELTCRQAEAALSACLQRSVSCSGIDRLSGGMINTVLRLEFDQPPYRAVIKLNSGENNFVEEAASLVFLHAHTRFPCPQVYLQDTSRSLLPYPFLLLEDLPGKNLAEVSLPEADRAAVERQLAEVLLELHSHTRLTYGAPVEETAGKGTGGRRWDEVFLPRLREVRAAPEIEQRLSPFVLEEVDSAIQAAEKALQDGGIPTLIHGDIWDGNLIVRSEKGSWRLVGIVDPALHYADVEEELAYLEVFGTPRKAFFDFYTAARPLRPGYDRRRLFYWLYTALIHVWLFGNPHYCDFAARTANAIRKGENRAVT